MHDPQIGEIWRIHYSSGAEADWEIISFPEAGYGGHSIAGKCVAATQSTVRLGETLNTLSITVSPGMWERVSVGLRCAECEHPVEDDYLCEDCRE